MSPVAILVLALALSMDNFAMALAAGASQTARGLGVLRLPIVFGICSWAAPIAGWFCGSQAAGFAHGYAGAIAFAVLVAVGWRMLRSAWAASNDHFELGSLRATLLLGIATSGDALAAGFALGMTHANIVQASAAIGFITAAVSLLGMVLGVPLGAAFGARSKVAAGIVLMLVGAHALVAS